AVGRESDADNHDEHDTPRVSGEPAQCTIEACRVVGVVVHRGPQQEVADESKTDASADLADGADLLDEPSIARLSSRHVELVVDVDLDTLGDSIQADGDHDQADQTEQPSTTGVAHDLGGDV